MMNFRDITFHPTNPNKLYALSTEKVFESEDLGNNWTEMASENYEGTFREIDINPANPNQMFITGSSLMRWNSTNQIWENITDGVLALLPTDIKDFRLGSSVYNNEFYFLIFLKKSSDVEYNMFAKTNDYGENFIELANGNASSIGYARSFVLNFEMSSSGLFYGGGVTMHKAELPYNISDFDGINSGLHTDIRDICFPDPSNPNFIITATDGGIGMTETGSQPWADVTGDLALNEIYTVSISEQDPNIFLTGQHDNGTHKSDSVGVWKHVFGGDGGATAISTIHNDTIYIRGNFNLRVSFNGGTNWISTNIETPILDYPILLHPTNPNIVFAATQAKGSGLICRSVDAGSHFIKDNQQYSATTPIDSSWAWSWGLISAMAIPKSNPEILYYSSYDHWNYYYFGIRRKEDTILLVRRVKIFRST